MQSASQDSSAQTIAVASIRRRSTDPHLWRHTVVGCVHPGLAGMIELLPGELPIASGFFHPTAWWLVSTQRIVGKYQGVQRELDPRFGIEHTFGFFKRMTPQCPETAVATVTSKKTGSAVPFEFETGDAAMAPMYACMFWAGSTGFHHQTHGDS